MKVLVSGGAGFIGSITCVELLNAGYEIAVFDNLSNSSASSIENIKKVTGKDFNFYECDMRDEKEMDKIFRMEKCGALIHFAGYKAVGESVEKPLMYYENNISGSLVLFKLCKKYGVDKIIFSSSATVYGLSEKMPVREDAPLSVTNPYGRTKLMLEDILRDIAAADKDLSVVLLRYFNPVGAHESLLLGENPLGIPNNIMPKLIKSASGEESRMYVFGNDYDTRDGTCIRDYIHVADLAKGHVCALKYTENGFKGAEAFNLGRGEGITVLELIKTFEKVNNLKIDYEFTERRKGDVGVSFADASKARKKLGFCTTKTLEDMCRDSWLYYLKRKENGK